MAPGLVHRGLVNLGGGAQVVLYVCPCLLPIRSKGTNPVSLTVGAVMGPGHLEEAGRIDYMEGRRYCKGG